jgi:hypothetical protein
MEITPKQWDQLVRRLGDIESSIADDRRDIDKISIILETVKAQNDKILGMQSRTQGKIESAVENAVSQTIEPMSEKVDTLVEKKILKVNKDQVKELGMLQKLHRKVKGWR